jgi:hypothetical protein
MTPQSGVDFRFEWTPADGVKSSELAATWARLEIWIGANCVSQLEDRDSGASRRSMFVSMYPLAEWAAYNWWQLQANLRPAAVVPDTWSLASPSQSHSAGGAKWQRSHNLRGAGDGFLWPNLSLLPEGNVTRAIWRADPWPDEYARVRYLGQGADLIGTSFVRAALQEVIESTITKLDESGVRDTPLHQEWSAIAGLPDDERAFCLAIARLGLDPFDLEGDIAESVVAAADLLPEPLLTEFLDSVEVQRFSDGLAWVQDGLGILQDGPAARPVLLHDYQAPAITSYTQPWDAGYAQAHAVRAALGVDQSAPFPIDELIAKRVRGYLGRGLQALGGAGANNQPSLILAKNVGQGPARFSEARALWFLLHRPDRAQYLVTESRSDENRLNRAFAAEVLAPAGGIAELLGEWPASATQSDIEFAAEHFQVSPVLIERQIENQLVVY